MPFSFHSLESLSLAISTVGVLFLFACTVFLEARETSFYELDESFLGEKVKLKGSVLWFRNAKGTALFELTDEMGLKRLKGVIFSPSKEQWRILKQGGWVSVEGRIETYKNEIELIVEKIESLGWEAG